MVWLDRLYLWLQNFKRDESGQGLAEYGLILFLVAIVVVAALGALGTRLDEIFNSVKDSLTNPPN